MNFRWKDSDSNWGEYMVIDAQMGNDAAIFLPKSGAIRLAREVLRFYGAPLEKPEPMVGQVWRRENGKLVVIVMLEDGWVHWIDSQGTDDSINGKDFIVFFEFVAESWAGEEK